MLTIPESELIYLESLMSVCDYVYDGPAMDKEPPSGVIWVHNDNIARFFRRCRRNRYVVISGNSDFSLHYQAEHHPNTDLRRLSAYQPWKQAAEVRDSYVSLQVGPACNTQECDSRDRYSLKTFCFTKSTFPAIPDNIVRWFVANTMVTDDQRIEWLPYGLSPQKGPPRAEVREKSKLLYVNFQNNTDERVSLNSYYPNRLAWATHVPDANRPLLDYWQDIADHKFVLCPSGNGLDCYRTYETLYLGSVPIMRRTPFSESLFILGLPVLLVDSLFNIDPVELVRIDRRMDAMTFCLEPLKLSYWKNRVEEARKLL